jgi:hypothetical protein
MQKRTALVLLAILGLTAIWMIGFHLLLFPQQGVLGFSGIGMIAVALMAINKQWLYPSAPPMPRQALVRSVLVALVLGTCLTLLFGALLAS